MLADLARALAWIEGRDYLTPADVQQAFYPMARHRLVLNNAIPGQLTPDSRLVQVLERVPL